MLDQGIVMLISARSSPPAAGGFFAELPKDYTLAAPAWTYRSISGQQYNGLQFFKGLATERLQIDCYGADAADVITLANDIDQVLQGFRGNLPDPDATQVDSIFSSDVPVDFFDDSRRSYRRMLEYEISYYRV